nr:MAG TPA: hypothetical protein [Caudoviricetes sp.]DAK40874.1 MAG TPA: hypothetical protein [Caudoviricetes sp.]
MTSAHIKMIIFQTPITERREQFMLFRVFHFCLYPPSLCIALFT